MYGVSAKPWKSWKQRRLCFSHFQPTCRVLSNHEKSSESAGLGHQGSFTWQMQGYPYFAPKMHLRPFKMKANISRYHTCHTSISNTMFIECSSNVHLCCPTAYPEILHDHARRTNGKLQLRFPALFLPSKGIMTLCRRGLVVMQVPAA